MVRLWPLLFFLLHWPAPSAAAAADVIRVRGKSELQIVETGRSLRKGGRLADVRLQISLRDAASGEPIPAQPMQLLVTGATPSSLVLRGDRAGVARADLAGLRTGLHQIVGRFAGDALCDGASAALDLDLQRRGVKLALAAPERAPLLGELRVQVSLKDEDNPLPGPVELRIAGAPVPVSLRGGSGEGSLKLDPAALRELRGGEHANIEAIFRGDAFHDGATARRAVLLTTQTQLFLDAPPRSGEVARGAALVLSGSARDEEGPVVGETVALSLAEPGPEGPLASAAVDGAGRFQLRLAHLDLPIGPAQLVAAIKPARSHRGGARSQPLRLLVLPPEPVSLSYFVVPLGVVLFLFGLPLLLRQRSRLAALLRRRRRATLERAKAAAAQEAPQPGVTLRPRSTVQSILARPDFTVSGQVYDAAFGGPVIAEVVIGGAAPVLCDDEGRFILPLLPPGSHPIEVRAAGYLLESFVAQLPHRGELRAVRVALLPIRARMMAAWRGAARPLLPPSADVATWTPREVLRRAHMPAPLRRLTELVEAAYYSGRPPELSALREAEQLASEIAAHTAPQAPSSPAPRGAAPIAAQQ